MNKLRVGTEIRKELILAEIKFLKLTCNIRERSMLKARVGPDGLIYSTSISTKIVHVVKSDPLLVTGLKVSLELYLCKVYGYCVVPENIHTSPTEGILFCTPPPPFPQEIPV